MRIAYLILGHAHPEQMVRAIEALRHGGAVGFVVHVDKRAESSVYAAMARYAAGWEDVWMAPRFRCYWGSYGIVRATFGCLRTLLESGVEFEYAALISGQDYPVCSGERLREFFAARVGREFIEAFRLDEANRWTPQGGMFQAMERVRRPVVFLRSRMVKMPWRRGFYEGWQPFGGSQWWCLSRQALGWLDERFGGDGRLRRFFRFVFIPDECMVQTMMGNSPFADRISAETLTYIDWERPNPKYPRTLDEEDFERVRGSGKLWARKVHPERSAGFLERVDRELF